MTPVPSTEPGVQWGLKTQGQTLHLEATGRHVGQNCCLGKGGLALPSLTLPLSRGEGAGGAYS